MIERIVVVNDLSNAAGGASALAIASASAFRKAGYPTAFLTGDDGLNPELSDLGVEITGLGAGRLLDRGASALLTGLYNRPAFGLVRNWIEQNDTPGTVYHLHGWSQTLSPSVFHALKPVNRRLVLSAHDFFLGCPNGSYSFFSTGDPCVLTPMSFSCVSANCDRRNRIHKLWRVARQAIYRSFVSNAEFPPVLAIHENMRDALVKSGIPDARIHALPNPVTPYTAERIPAEDNTDFMFIGRLESTKGPDLAAAAARRAGARVHFIGDGQMRASLQAEYPEMIFSGHQPRDRIAELLKNARALLMPSRYPEPFGLVAVEALWSGLPVIAARTALLTPAIEAANAGFGCDPQHAESFAGRIGELMKERALCRTLSENAFNNTANLAMTPHEWIRRLLSVYTEVIESARNQSSAAA